MATQRTSTTYLRFVAAIPCAALGVLAAADASGERAYPIVVLAILFYFAAVPYYAWKYRVPVAGDATPWDLGSITGMTFFLFAGMVAIVPALRAHFAVTIVCATVFFFAALPYLTWNFLRSKK